jgi:hypothetical protein
MVGLRVAELLQKVADECQLLGQPCLKWWDARAIHNGAVQRWLHHMPDAASVDPDVAIAR